MSFINLPFDTAVSDSDATQVNSYPPSASHGQIGRLLLPRVSLSSLAVIAHCSVNLVSSGLSKLLVAINSGTFKACCHAFHMKTIHSTVYLMVVYIWASCDLKTFMSSSPVCLFFLSFLHSLTVFPELRGPRAPAVVDYEATVLVWAATKDEDQAKYCEDYNIVPFPDAAPAKGKSAPKASKSIRARSQPQQTAGTSSDEEEMLLIPPGHSMAKALRSPPHVARTHHMPTKRARFESLPASPVPRPPPVLAGVKRKASADDHYAPPEATSSARPQKALPGRSNTQRPPTSDFQPNPVPQFPSRELNTNPHPDRDIDHPRYRPPVHHPHPQALYEGHNGYIRPPNNFQDQPLWAMDPTIHDRQPSLQYLYPNHSLQPQGYGPAPYITRPRNHQPAREEQFARSTDPYNGDQQMYYS